MKKIVFVLVVLLLFSGCLGYFNSAEKTTTIELTEERIYTQIEYKGTLNQKGKAIDDCKEEIKELFPSVQAGLEANANDPDETKRKIVQAKLILLKEIEESIQCSLTDDGTAGNMKISFVNSTETIKELSRLIPEEGFILTDVNKDLGFVKIKPETKEYFSSEITKENLRIKTDGEILEIIPGTFTIKDGFIEFYDTQKTEETFIEIDFLRKQIDEFPLFLVAVSFIILISIAVIVVVWKRREPEEVFKKSDEQIEERMKKELINGLGTIEIQIINFEKNKEGYEAEAMIKTRKYNITYNKKMELKDYIRIEDD